MSAPTDLADLDARTAAFKHTDYGNAERLVARYGDDLRFCHQSGRWLVWDDTRWCPDATGEAMRRAKDTVRAIYREAATVTDDDARVKLAKHAALSERSARLKALLELATSEHPVSTDIADLDRDPWLFNVANGTLELRTGTFRPHERADLLTRRSDVAYSPEATCPRWLRFLDEVLADREAVAYVQKLFGYALTGDVSDQSLILLHGDGANGKTTLLNVLLDLAGDYGAQAAPDLLLADRRDAHPTAMADLQGRRPVVASEVNDGRRFDEALVKLLTGGDLITARRMRQDYFTFTPTHTLFLAVNHLPDIRGRDNGIWRRMRPVGFPNRFSETDRDPQLADTLRRELPGILNWAVQGAQQWHRDGHLDPPPSVVAATETYRQETDPLAEFIAECCILDPTARTSARSLYDAYLVWHRHSGDGQPLSGRAFGLQLSRLGYDKLKSGIVYRRGLKLQPAYLPPLF